MDVFDDIFRIYSFYPFVGVCILFLCLFRCLDVLNTPFSEIGLLMFVKLVAINVAKT